MADLLVVKTIDPDKYKELLLKALYRGFNVSLDLCESSKDYDICLSHVYSLETLVAGEERAKNFIEENELRGGVLRKITHVT